MGHLGEIRTVYAVLPNGDQIVRYDRSKRWFLEDAAGQRKKRFRRVSDAAALAHSSNADVFEGQPEGSYFDKYVSGHQNGSLVPNMQRYTEAGLRRELRYAQARWSNQQKKSQNHWLFKHYVGLRDRYKIGSSMWRYYDRYMATNVPMYDGMPKLLEKHYYGKKVSDVEAA